MSLLQVRIERAIYRFLSLILMVNPFEMTPAEKEECVIDMLERGYGWNQVMKECHVSPNTISSIVKRNNGYTEADTSKSGSQISKETQALKLFSQGKTLFGVAIELDISTDTVLVFYQNYLRLKNMQGFISAYEQAKGNIQPFLHMFNLINGLGMTPEVASQLAVCGIRLPYLWNIHLKLSNNIRMLTWQNQRMASQLYNIQYQLEQCMESLQYYNNQCEKKRCELIQLNQEAAAMKNLIENFDNHEGYRRIRKESAEQTKSIMKNNRLLIAVSVSSSLEALRRYPRNQELFYQLSLKSGYSKSNQESWMQPHADELLRMSEQVENEIAERIVRSIVGATRLLPDKFARLG